LSNGLAYNRLHRVQLKSPVETANGKGGGRDEELEEKTKGRTLQNDCEPQAKSKRGDRIEEKRKSDAAKKKIHYRRTGGRGKKTK